MAESYRLEPEFNQRELAASFETSGEGNSLQIIKTISWICPNSNPADRMESIPSVLRDVVDQVDG